MRNSSVPHLAGALALLAVGLATLATGCPFKAEEFQRLCDKAADCADGNPCTDDKCTAGVCENSNKAKGSSCGLGREGVCDGAGSCVECTSSAGCAAAHPDKPICDIKTQTCVSCFDGVKNGAEEDVDCGGPDCGACLGQPCDPTHGCGRDKETSQLWTCAMPENVCCKTACNLTCEACSSAKTGQPDGTCAPIAEGQDPDAECTNVNQKLGKCSSVPNSCQCSDGQKNYEETDVDCGGPTCAGCGGGKKCGSETDCANDVAHCVNGACCNDKCNFPCKACNSVGQCVPVPGGTDDPFCTNNTTCSQSGGSCVGKTGAHCAANGDCLSLSCPGTGANRTCAQSPLNGSCSTTADCAAGTCQQNHLCQ
jgi:hypothetical protein